MRKCRSTAGTALTGSSGSFGLSGASGTGFKNYRNNILVNARSSGGSTGSHFAITLPSGSTTGLDCNNNLLLATGTESADSGGELIVAWAEIDRHAPVGWLRLEVAPSAAENLHHIITDSVLAGLITVLFGTAAILYFLHPQLQSLKRATTFAEGLDSSDGKTLDAPNAAAEVRQLVDALNLTSIRLFESKAALAASESHNRAITEAALDCIITIDEHGAIIEFNPAAARTFGIPHSAAINQPVTRLKRYVEGNS